MDVRQLDTSKVGAYLRELCDQVGVEVKTSASTRVYNSEISKSTGECISSAYSCTR